MKSAMALEKQYGARNYAPLEIELVRGQGVMVWDVRGKRYVDMMSAYSAVSFGHAHPELVDVLGDQARRLAVTSRAFYTDQLGPFLRDLCQVTGMDRALPMNTGAEAVETAIKAARKWAYRTKGVGANSAQIIVCDGNFAGRTTTIVGFSSEAQYRDGFGPFAPGFVRVPYGDIEALDRAITPSTAAFIVEPIQGEAGIVVPPKGYLAQAATLCRERRVLLICDEVQTGLARTGRNFCCEYDSVVPDGLILGKALGGGLVPVSAFVSREEVMAVFTPGDHGSTFGGNPLAAAVGRKALEILDRDRLAERALERGEQLRRGLVSMDSPLVKEIRGKGLLIGVEVRSDVVTARHACEVLAQHGILSKDTHGTVIRFAPPLIISAEEVDFALHQISRAFIELEKVARLPDTRVPAQAA